MNIFLNWFLAKIVNPLLLVYFSFKYQSRLFSKNSVTAGPNPLVISSIDFYIKIKFFFFIYFTPFCISNAIIIIFLLVYFVYLKKIYNIMIKIIDCFIFYNELDLLTYRLNLLNNIVDYFIIVESTHTFVGKEKNLFYNENKHLFEDFNKKIIHIIVDDFPYKHFNANIHNNDVWTNEIFQRNAISRGISCISNLSNSDVIIISDLDEIPDPFTLISIKKCNIVVDINILEMDLYYYNLNNKFNFKWDSCKILSYKKYIELNTSCNNIRNTPCSKILNGGWHLSYFGDKYFIQNKIQNFSHQELNNSEYTDLEKIEKRIKNSRDLYDRDFNIINIKIEDNTYLPIDYDKYLNKYYKVDFEM